MPAVLPTPINASPKACSPGPLRAARPAVAAGLAALLLLGAVGCGGSSPSAAPTPSDPTPPPASAAGSTAPASLGLAVRQWYASLAGQFAALQRDTEQIVADAGAQDVTALNTHCAQLRADVVRLLAAPAAPDRRIAAAVGTAMQTYGQAAQSCLAGDYGATAAELTKAGASLEAGNAIMNNSS